MCLTSTLNSFHELLYELFDAYHATSLLLWEGSFFRRGGPTGPSPPEGDGIPPPPVKREGPPD